MNQSKPMHPTEPGSAKEESSTIVGIATAPGEGGIAIIRISGEKAQSLFGHVFQAPGYQPPYPDHLLMYGKVKDGEKLLDEAMGVVMLAPRTYTREDVCELHLHGGYGVAGQVLRLLLRLGAQPAQPGEFTRRAFMNGRIDLMQAEAVMGVIASRSEAALKCEERLLQGGQSAFIRDAQEKLTNLLAGLEAHIDYPEEISQEEATAQLRSGICELIRQLSSAVDTRAARIVREGLHVAVFGRPNAGKSTLFNALLEEDRAIVSEIPGTTRDVLEGGFVLEGYQVWLRDTAGMRSTLDPVETIGVDRAKKTVSQADALLLLVDAASPLTQEDRELLAGRYDCPCALLLNKQDEGTLLSQADMEKVTALRPILPISAKTGAGLENVRGFLKGLIQPGSEELLTHERHMQIVTEVCSRLKAALAILDTNQPIDFAAVDLHESLYLLGRITGESVDETLLDDIFSRFCVGK